MRPLAAGPSPAAGSYHQLQGRDATTPGCTGRKCSGICLPQPFSRLMLSSSMSSSLILSVSASVSILSNCNRQNSRAQLIQLLLAGRRSDVLRVLIPATSNDGLSAIDYAAQRGFVECVALLQQVALPLGPAPVSMTD